MNGFHVLQSRGFQPILETKHGNLQRTSGTAKGTDGQIEAARKAELNGAVQHVQQLVAEYGLTADDVFGAPKKASKSKGGTVAAKYCDPATGATWTGRGKAPRWIADQDRSQFAI